MRILRMAAVAAAMVASPAWAQKMATFEVGGATFEMPIPAGYCLPEGPTVQVAESLARADQTGVTNLSLFACDYGKGGKMDYILVKTPKAAVSLPIERDQILAQLRREFASPQIMAQIAPDKVNGQMSDGLSGTFGQKVEVDGKLAPRGMDEVCGYLAGVLSYEMDAGKFSTEISGCMTAVGNRIIFVFYYNDGNDAAAALRNVAKAKAYALTIRQTGGI